MEVVGAVGAAACCCACVLGLCMLSSRSNCYQMWQDRRRRNELISGCSCSHYKCGDHTACQNETCPICLEDFNDKTWIVVTPCKHGFHKTCLITCLEISHHCPFCKAVVCQAGSISNSHIDVEGPREREPLIL